MIPYRRFVLLAVAGALAALLAPRGGLAGKIRARATKNTIPRWKWDIKATKLNGSIARYKGKHRISVTATRGLVRKGVVTVERLGRTVLRFAAHAETPFVVLGDRLLVFSTHHAFSSGCTLIAIDLKTKKQRWKTRLKGVGPVGHSEYRNRINLRAGPGAAVTVFGWESYGRYIEVVDLKSGKTLHHRKVPGRP